jgi:superfamily I DNA/RNA helicase/mRNA-degrading endonuclease YafQ of YafQ-DinJ toxin-antitoxin module
MIALALAQTFDKSLAKLTTQEQATVKQIPTDFMLNPKAPGHRLHKLNCREKRFASISANKDLRIIVLKDTNQLVFCYVGHHDDSYRWAERREVQVHPTTGAAQVVEFEEVVREVIREELRIVQREIEVPPLFANEHDDYLLSLGVPQAWITAVKTLDEDGFYQILERLPEEAAEALLAIAVGERPEPSDPLDPGVDPFQHPDARRRFWVASDERALARALDSPWDSWIVFLHPSQREAVERNFNGPARVSGGAGTGKTVVALHRAVYLAEMSNNARVLLTTYSRPLVAHLEHGLDRLAGTSSDVRRRIQVEHLHRYALELAKDRAGFSFAPVTPSELSGFIGAAMVEHPEIKASKEFLRAEFDAVIDYWGVKDWKTYRDIQRSGRGAALSSVRRKQIWPIFESVTQQMREAGRMTFSDLADAARKIVEAKRHKFFQYVVADEVQDFGPREVQLLAALAPTSAHSHFFTGDVGQRIYRYPFSWLRAGVDIRGRAARLKVNYRTTHQIKCYADRSLGAVISEESDQIEDRRAISLLSGPEPRVLNFASSQEEAFALAEWFEALAKEGIQMREVAVFARTTAQLKLILEPALEHSGRSARQIGDDRRLDSSEIWYGTLHAAKGLEFRAVALVGCNVNVLPHPNALAAADDDEGRDVARTRERQLFYVGCTRARDVLRISYSGDPSPFLADANADRLTA